MSSNDEIRNETKSLLSSLIISCPKGLTIKRLRKDYQDEVGYDVPFKKLGYADFELFLNSIPETCVVQGYGDNALVIPVLNAKNKHINDMIMKQKPPKLRTGRRSVPRRSRGIEKVPLLPLQKTPVKLPALMSLKIGLPPADYYIDENRRKSKQINQKNNSNVDPKINKIKSNIYTSHQETFVKKSENLSNNKNVKNNSEQIHSYNLKNGNTCLNQEITDNHNENIHLNKAVSENHMRTELLQSTVENMNNTQYTNHLRNNCNSSLLDEYSSELDFPFDEEECYYYSDDEDEFESLQNLKISHEKSSNFNCNHNEENDVSYTPEFYISDRVNDAVKEKLKILISENPNGIWCSKLPTEYWKRWNQELDPFEFGFESMSQLCTDLSDVFYCIRPNKTDWKLFDRRLPKPNPDKVLEWCHYVKQSTPVKGEMTTSCEFQNTPPVLRIRYPKDVFRLGDTIDKQWIRGSTKLNDYIELIVAEVYDPSKFWIQLRGEHTAVALSTLMDEMQLFYLHNKERYQLTRQGLQVGLYCAAIFAGEYHRAIILRVFDDDTLKLFYIDYGTVAECHISKICFLHLQFGSLLQQAVRSRLSNIIPIENNTMWPRAAGQKFLKMVTDRNLIGLVTFIDYENMTLSVILTDTTLPDVDIHINDVLVDEGYAKIGNQAYMCSTSSATVPNVHLYPNFSELEQGMYPTVLDLDRFLKLGHSYEVIFKEYFRPPSYCGSYSYEHDGGSSLSFAQSLPDETGTETFQSDEGITSESPYSSEQLSIDNDISNEYNEERLETSKSPEDEVENTSDLPSKLVKPPPGFEKIIPSTENVINICNLVTPSVSPSVPETVNTNNYNSNFLLNSSLVTNPVARATQQMEHLNLNSGTIYPGLGLNTDLIALHSLQQIMAYEQAKKIEEFNLIRQQMEQNILQNWLANQSTHVANNENQGQNISLQNISNLETVDNNTSDASANVNVRSDLNNVSVSNPKKCDHLVNKREIGNSTVHIFKIDNIFYMITQEVITQLLGSPLSFGAWIKENGLYATHFPSKVFNLLHYQELYDQLTKYDIPGIPKPGPLGCNIRLSALEAIFDLLEEMGKREFLADVEKCISSLNCNQCSENCLTD